MQKFGTSDKTNFVESLHALVLQIAIREQRDVDWDFIVGSFAKYSRTVNHSFKSMDLVKKSSPDWQRSAVKTANALRRRFPANSIVHRDSSIEAALRKKFMQLNAKERKFNQWDKYQPADIYVTNAQFRPVLHDKKSLSALNTYLREQAEKKTFVGISLKKIIGQPRVEEVNYGRNQAQIVHGGFQYSAPSKTPDSTKIVWMKAREGMKTHTFEMRTNAPWGSWSVQLDGGSHYGGKAGIKAVNEVLTNNGAQPLPDAVTVRNSLNTNPKPITDETIRLLQKHSSFSRTQVDSTDPTWVYSKYLGLKLADNISKVPKAKQDQITKELVLYAGSRSEDSAPHLKVY